MGNKCLIALVSFALGGVSGYFIGKKFIEARLTEEMNERINEEIKRIEKRYSKPKEEKGFIESKGLSEAVSKHGDALSRNAYADVLTERKLAEREFPQEDEPEEENADYDETEDIHISASEWAEREPEIISEEDYTNLPGWFSFVTFQYFDEDDTLVDEGEIPIDDPDLYIGDALAHFGELCDNEDHVYVVNGSMGLAAEVIRLHTSYERWSGLND